MANIVNTRIDERLIHGQVAAFWTNTLNVSRIMVIDDLCAVNDIQKMALKMACPAGVKLSVLPIDRAVEKLNDPANYVDERLFVVFSGTASVKEAIFKGAPIKKVTVGNISNKVGSSTVYHSVCVTPADVENFRTTASEKGIEFVAQMVPSDEPTDFIKLIEKL